MRRTQHVPGGDCSSGPQSRSRSPGQHLEWWYVWKENCSAGGGSIEQGQSEDQLMGDVDQRGGGG